MNDDCAWCRYYDPGEVLCTDPARSVHFDDGMPTCPVFEGIVLLPCPFCGGEAEVTGLDGDGYYTEPGGEYTEGLTVRCRRCDARCGCMEGVSPAEAAEAWNRRPGGSA